MNQCIYCLISPWVKQYLAILPSHDLHSNGLSEGKQNFHFKDSRQSDGEVIDCGRKPNVKVTNVQDKYQVANIHQLLLLVNDVEIFFP